MKTVRRKKRSPILRALTAEDVMGETLLWVGVLSSPTVVAIIFLWVLS